MPLARCCRPEIRLVRGSGGLMRRFPVYVARRSFRQLTASAASKPSTPPPPMTIKAIVAAISHALAGT
jgi:hypothetical protein